MKGIVEENTNFSYTILHIPGYAIPMYEYEYRDKYGIIPLKTVHGDYAPIQALLMKTSRRRPRGRVVDQPDDECRKRSTSRLHRLAAKKILPSGLRISGAAEEVEVDPKSSSTAACQRKVLSLLSRFQSYGTTRERRGREERGLRPRDE